MSTPCGFVTCLLLHVLLCVFMLHRVPLHIRVSPETRQRLQLVGTQRHLNLGSRLRALIDEALDREFGPAPNNIAVSMRDALVLSLDLAA